MNIKMTQDKIIPLLVYNRKFEDMSEIYVNAC